VTSASLDPGAPRPPLRVVLLTSRSIPHIEADVEQVVRTAAALSVHPQIATALIFRSAGAASDPKAVRADIAGYYGVDLDRVELVPVRTPVNVPRAFGFITCGRAAGPQMIVDASAVPPIMAALRRLRQHVVITRRWPLAAAASHLGLPTFYETHSPSTAATLVRIARTFRWRGIIAHSDWARRAYVAAGFPDEAVRVIRNGYDPSLFEVGLDRRVARARLGLDDRESVACYAGRLGSKKHPESLIRAAGAMPEVRVLLVGATDDAECARLQAIARACGASNVTIVKRVRPAALSPYLVAADVLLLAPTAAPLSSGRTVLPLKTYMYLGAGRPIVAPTTPDLQEVLVHGRNAWLTPPGDPQAVADAVRWLLRERTVAHGLAEQARLDAASCTWTARAEGIETFVRSRSGLLA
jgi:glycosyltransferase involved in cell wall biosynthesis